MEKAGVGVLSDTSAYGDKMIMGDFGSAADDGFIRVVDAVLVEMKAVMIWGFVGSLCRQPFHNVLQFARGRSGLCAAHGNAATAAAAAVGGGSIGHGLFEKLVSATTMDSSSGASAVSDCCTTESSENSGKANEPLENMGKRQSLIPAQVLVPSVVKLSRAMPSRMATVTSEGKSGFVIPEGRVHGGGLLTLLGGSIRNPGTGVVGKLMGHEWAIRSILCGRQTQLYIRISIRISHIESWYRAVLTVLSGIGPRA
ncbi:hypothetical protein MA16_Dca013511 [Dendrobium catenatum]|uniref:Uncharacterized protein n=1 Tax=Dendrobium catenatum TaxID=906689 RepID=A0A2I0W481_9ASPA|nr:hypothetical protein MA16_Dca013511 [Dendrobium catenatum]